MEKKTHWGEVSDWYNELVGLEGSEYHQQVIFPKLIKTINSTYQDLSNLQMLDLACGQGALCRLLTKSGIKMTGIDLAAPLIESAIQYDRDKQINYIVGDVTKLVDDNGNLIEELSSKHYDAIFIILAIQNISPLSPVWQACQKLLKIGGKLFIVMMHPSFRIPQFADWHWNEKENRQERIVWKYLKSQEIPILTNPSHLKESKKTVHFHRPLQAYINTLANNGLLIEQINEWVTHKKEQTGKKSIQLDTAKSEIPLFMQITAVKI